MKLRLIVLIVISALLTGCTSATLQIRDSKYGPVGEKRGGTTSYLNDGANSAVRKRRELAYKKMYELCDGRYKITNEYDRSDDAVGFVYGGVASAHRDTYRYIEFDCED